MGVKARIGFSDESRSWFFQTFPGLTRIPKVSIEYLANRLNAPCKVNDNGWVSFDSPPPPGVFTMIYDMDVVDMERASYEPPVPSGNNLVSAECLTISRQ